MGLFKWRGIYDKCRNKVVKRAGLFCRNFCVGHGQYPPLQRVWCRGCYVKHLEDDLPKSGKESRGDWEGDLEGRYKNGGGERSHYYTFSV